MTIHARSSTGFRSLLRISCSSLATPPWFASPVDATEDDEAITVVFHAPEESHGPVRVHASDQAVTVLGRSQSMRLCALPSAITGKVETHRTGDLLRVRMPKKRSVNDSTRTNPAQEGGVP